MQPGGARSHKTAGKTSRFKRRDEEETGEQRDRACKGGIIVADITLQQQTLFADEEEIGNNGDRAVKGGIQSELLCGGARQDGPVCQGHFTSS